VNPPIRIVQLGLDELRLLGQIDRSEHVQVLFSVKSGRLESRPADVRVPAWEHDGTGEHSLVAVTGFVEPIVSAGGEIFGAFVGELLGGVVVVDPAFEDDAVWLAFLHVDRSHRRVGVASRLWTTAVDRARAAGATSIYVSATPSESAVGFYLSRGCTLATRSQIRPHLYALEPDDIHLVCSLEQIDDGA
jgi:ribosomal protein S18 acetylase RimI-like enzyme